MQKYVLIRSLRVAVLVICISSVVTTISCNQKTDDFISNHSTYQKDHFIKIPTEQGDYCIRLYTDYSIETSFIPKGEIYDPYSHAVAEYQGIAANLIETDSLLVYGNNGIRVEITKKPFHISYHYKEKELISEYRGYIQTDTTELLDFKLDTEEIIYGAGARILGMNRRGNRLQLYNKAHYGYETRSELMNYTMPLVLSSKIYAVHFDNGPIGFLDIDSKQDRRLQYERIHGRKTYQVIAGDNWKDVMNQYTNLTGKQPLPPRWALGNFASRFGYHSEAEIKMTIEKFKKDSIPLDAVVLDIYWFGKEMKGNMGNLEFLKDSFPNPKKMINDFRKKGIKTVLITEPFILATSKRWEEAVAKEIVGKDVEGNPYQYEFYFGTTGIIDIYNPKGKEWFWNIYKKYTQEYGVAGWWGDLGEPEVHPSDLQHATGTADAVHNTYGHDWARLIHEGYKKDFPNQRPFILMRAGYSGSQRFGMIPWSGDVNRSWGGLQSQTEIALSMGMQGLGYMHSDLGGFAGGETFDPELYTRWLQYGVFQPIYRPHAQEHIAPEPVFHDPKTKALAKQSIMLRYRMLPYNYTVAFDNNQTGVPLMRPLFFEENTKELQTVTDTYLWGDSFLVTPITRAGITSKKVYFPSGTHWYDFYTDAIYKGGTYHVVSVVEDHIPVFVKGGSFIPMISPIQHTEDYSTEKFILHYYYDQTVTHSIGKLYDDDGITPNAFEKGEYEVLNFESTSNDQILELQFTATTGVSYTTMDRTVELVIHYIEKQPSSVVVDAREVPVHWNEKQKTLHISTDWSTIARKHIQVSL